MPVANAMAGVHRDRLVLVFIAQYTRQCYNILAMPQGEIVFADMFLVTTFNSNTHVGGWVVIGLQARGRACNIVTTFTVTLLFWI